MKHFAKIFLYSLMFFNSYVFCHTYKQLSHIVVYAESSEAPIYNLLNKFDINYKKTQQLISSDDQSLYIVSGRLSSLAKLNLPRYYILHQTESLVGSLDQKQLNLLSKAVSVWDYSQKNISQYSNTIKNYYYVPDADYEFLDPVVLSCFLPLNAMDSYRKMLEYSNSKSSDISSHIPSLFCHAVFQNPAFIVEAGVRGGESTIALHAVALLKKASLVGIDIVDCSQAYSSFSNALFLQIDDMKFASYLPQLSKEPKTIDLVFIDTSHEYRHTLGELGVFVPLLAEQGALAFHDSNVTPLNNNSGYERIDGTSQFGIYGNPRGVTQAIKEFFDLNFNEYAYLNQTFLNRGFEWNIVHYPYCNGLTVIKKMKKV